MPVSKVYALTRKLGGLIGLAKAPVSAAKPASADASTRISQSLEDVLEQLQGHHDERVLVIGPADFRAQVAASRPDLAATWASCAIGDVLQGAKNPSDVDYAVFGSVIVGGEGVATSYRVALAHLATAGVDRPVYWVGKDWEFCGGTLAAPSDVDEVEAVLFNHFRHYFGIKDSLLFRIEIYCGEDMRRTHRILRADESAVIRLSEFFPNRTAPTTIATFVSHPVLTRGRHYRLRVCADVFWKKSLTTLHGAHEFNRSANHKFEFRLSAAAYRDGDVILTLPNYARDLGADDQIHTLIDDEQRQATRSRTALLEETRVSATEISHSRYVGWKYAGYGGSNWYSLKPNIGPNGIGGIAGNHHASVPIAPLKDMAADAAELAEIGRLRSAGYVLDPHPIPVTRPEDTLRFGFDCDAANPAFSDLLVYIFNGEGALIDERRYQKPAVGVVFVEDLPGISQNMDASLALVVPDFERIGYRRKGFKTQFDLVVQNRISRDWDATEGQTCWRNTGVVVPGTAHFAGPAGPVLGRTNLTARVRYGKGYRTAVLACHASGRLNYRAGAALTLTVFNQSGQHRSAEVPITSFTWRYLWLDELIPELREFLGGTGVGPLIATSADADINCQIMTTSDIGAVSLQHMWGY